MGTWGEKLNEIIKMGSPFDIARRECLAKFSELTDRDTIAYYSGWCQKTFPDDSIIPINEDDMNGFMNAVRYLEKRERGINLILHTPGGNVSATEKIIHYLKTKFNNKIYTYVPQVAFSCGTLIALASLKIYMGDHSNLGPIDPHINNASLVNILHDVELAKKEMEENPARIPFWQPIIAQYGNGLVQRCIKEIQHVKDIAYDYLLSAMFNDNKDEKLILSIIEEFVDNTKFKKHDNPFNAEKCLSIGLKIEKFEDNQALQDAILSLHHCYMLTFTHTDALKIIENNHNHAYIRMFQQPQQPIPIFTQQLVANKPEPKK